MKKVAKEFKVVKYKSYLNRCICVSRCVTLTNTTIGVYYGRSI